MTAPKRDKDLLLELMRHPASVFYRDEKITVLAPQSLSSYEHYTEGTIQIPDRRFMSEQQILSGLHVVRTHRGETFVIRIVPGYYKDDAKFQFCVATPNERNVNVMNAKDALGDYVTRYPSLYKAFGEQAKKHAYLPLIENQTDEDIARALKKDTHNVVFIKNLTHKRKTKIVETYPDTLRFMDQTMELCMHAIRVTGGQQLQHVHQTFRTQKLCHLAVQSDARALKHVPPSMQTEAICMEAVKKDGTTLAFIVNPSVSVCIAAVNKSPDAWKYIKDEKILKKVRKLRGLKKYR